jgi:hypothetical protein
MLDLKIHSIDMRAVFAGTGCTSLGRVLNNGVMESGFGVFGVMVDALAIAETIFLERLLMDMKRLIGIMLCTVVSLKGCVQEQVLRKEGDGGAGKLTEANLTFD